jgi:hypothetical protein
MSFAGRVQACGTLGEFYEHGTGVPQSNSQAILFYQRACDAQQVRGVDLPKLQNRCEDALRLQGRPGESDRITASPLATRSAR